MQNRSDLSEYVIHFLRKQKTDDLPEYYFKDGEKYYPREDQTADMDEMACLKNIISEGGLRGGYSFRNTKPTIYGYDPVICFTEMPLFNLIEYAKQRNNQFRISSYGLAIRKKELYAIGGRPVIYGLSKQVEFKYNHSADRQHTFQRIIDPALLPFAEQYRYVAFNLNPDRYSDWSHEREWRITSQDDLWPEHDLFAESCDGLCIFEKETFSEVILIVRTPEEAIEIEEYVRPYKDSSYTRSSEFTTKIKFLILDQAIKALEKPDIKGIEDLSQSCFYEFKSPALPAEEAEKIRKLLIYCRAEAKKSGEEYLEAHTDFGFCGRSMVVSSQMNHPVIRYLFEHQLASCIEGNYNLKHVLDDIPSAQSLEFHRHVANKVVQILNKEYENLFSTYVWED